MRKSPRNLRVACNHAGLAHFGGIDVFDDFPRLLQICQPPAEDRQETSE